MTTPLTEVPVPGGPEELTAEWLTAALRSSFPDLEAVHDLEREAVGAGVGFTGQVVRLHAECLPPECSAPRRVIAKLAAPPGTARDLLNDFGGYQREMMFYLELAGRCGLPTPRCYFAARDETTGNFVMLMEDLAPATVGDQVAGATAEEAELVVTHLARFHATWWNKAWLLDQAWLQPPAHMAQRLPVLYEQGLEGLREVMAGRFPDLLRLVERLGDLVPALAERYDKAFPPRPFTLVHGDVRLDNLFLPAANDGRFCVIDWQAVAIGSAANDLAYWMILSLPTDVRRQHEDRLLRKYHSVLGEYGVKGYSLRDLRRDYGRGILVQLAGLPVLAANLDFSSERGQALATAALERIDAAAADLKAGRTITVLSWLLKLQNRARALGRLLRRREKYTKAIEQAEREQR